MIDCKEVDVMNEMMKYVSKKPNDDAKLASECQDLYDKEA